MEYLWRKLRDTNLTKAVSCWRLYITKNMLNKFNEKQVLFNVLFPLEGKG